MTSIRKFLGALWALILREPTYTQTLVVAAIATGTAFGLGWNGAQVGAVSALSAAFLGVLTRQAVTPIAAPVIPSGTTVTVSTPSDQPDEKVTV